MGSATLRPENNILTLHAKRVLHDGTPTGIYLFNEDGAVEDFVGNGHQVTKAYLFVRIRPYVDSYDGRERLSIAILRASNSGRYRAGELESRNVYMVNVTDAPSQVALHKAPASA